MKFNSLIKLILVVSSLTPSFRLYGSPFVPKPIYTMTILPIGQFNSSGIAINDHGSIVGVRDNNVPFLYDGTHVIDLILPTHCCGFVYDINNNNQAVGYSVSNWFSQAAPILFSGGTVHDLNPLLGPLSVPVGINDSGHFVGVLRPSSSGAQRGFVSDGHSVTELLPLTGYTGTIGVGINNAGQIIGLNTSLLSSSTIGVLYSPQSGIELDIFPVAINEAGDIAGYKGRVAAVYRNGSIELINLLYSTHDSGRASGINDRGDVVGTSRGSSYLSSRGFLYQDGRVLDLNHLVPDRDGWLIQTAGDVNSKGQIIGQALRRVAGRDELRAVIVEPTGAFDTPEPSTLALVLGGLVLVLRRSRRTSCGV